MVKISSTTFLFGASTDWFARHQKVCGIAVLFLVSIIDWVAR